MSDAELPSSDTESTQVVAEAIADRLIAKLAEVALEVESITKGGYNQAQKYRFVAADDVIADLRGPLLTRGVLVFGGVKSITERQRTTASGGETTISTVEVDFTFTDVRTGEELTLPWVGRGEDPMDKGLSKALTQAIKTFCRQQFLLPWGNEDPEADEGTDARAGVATDTVNMIENARGLSNAQLNAALVRAGLSAAEKPFGVFTRVPSEAAARVREALDLERSGAPA